MSGTEAVMAAVRCARFNAERPLVVTFGGAYHGWWDGMQVKDTAEITPRDHAERSRRDRVETTPRAPAQPAAGNERTPTDVLCLKDMNSLSLATIKSRASEIAAVLVNPLQVIRRIMRGHSTNYARSFGELCAAIRRIMHGHSAISGHSVST